MSDIEETFEVEAVAGIKKNFRKKTVEVYIKWKGQPRSKSSWEDLDGANCEELLQPFKKGIKRLKGQIKLDPDSEDETEEPLEKDTYEVEDVIGVMWDFDYGGIMYYIKWKGWDNKWNNWEPEDNVACPVFTDFFQESADFLREKYGKKAPKRRFVPETNKSSRSARALTPEVSDSDDEPVSRRPGPKSAKKAGPKSKTAAPGSSKRPGPKSATSRPGPMSKKVGPMSKKAGPMSKKVGPKSRTNGSSKSKHFSDSDDDSDKESESSDKVSNGSSKKAKSYDSDEESVSSTKKRPGPRSRVGPASSKPGPMSKKKPGPRSKVGGGDDESDSD